MGQKPRLLFPTLQAEFGYRVVTAYNLATGLALIVDSTTNRLPVGAMSGLYETKAIAERFGIDQAPAFEGDADFLATQWLRRRLDEIGND